jgi:hypothetical protein
MKKLILPFLSVLLATSLSGCGLMEDAFKAGVIFAIIIVAIIGLIIWLVRAVVRQIEKKHSIVLFKFDE